MCKIIISEGNNKIGKVPNISLPPIKTCNKRAGCTKGKCYALKSYRLYPSVKNAWDTNLKTYKDYPETYFEKIASQLSIKNPKLFRWHVSGDIPDKKYLIGMVKIANRFPDIKFLCFTKKYRLVLNQIDIIKSTHNLTVILSSWTNLKLPERTKINWFPIAWYQDGTEKRITNNSVECFGNCEHCRMCWNLKNLQLDVVFNHH